MQTDEQEHSLFEEERNGPPVSLRGKSRRSRLQQRSLVSNEQAGNYDRQHARGVEVLSGNVRDVRDRERQDRLERRIGDPLANRRVDQRDDYAEQHTTDCGYDERPPDLQHSQGAANGNDR